MIGAGLAGTITALRLAGQGRSVALIDLNDAPRPEFRAEQLVGPQIGTLAQWGLLDAMTRGGRLYTEALNGRLGRIVDATRVDQYGVPYEAMVRAARECLPPGVKLTIGRVAEIDCGPEIQVVRMSSGAEIVSRLVVMATGLSTVLPRRLGVEYRTIRAGHSLAVGFDLGVAGATAQTFSPMIYYGEDTRDRMDYIALFGMHDVIRANLFCYQEQQSEWARAFCRDPKPGLLALMPGLAKLIGSFEVTSPVQMRSNDLRVAQEPVRDGIVLVGDAFQTPCPAAGTGIDRLLSDVGILCDTYVPAWFVTPGMGQDKVAAFYADPTKRAYDAECLRIAEYRRAVSTQDSLAWAFHRKQVFFRRQVGALLARWRPGRETRSVRHTMAPSS